MEEKTSNAAPTPHTPSWLVILLLIFFPPAAWYFMWKEKRYHRWFAYVLWVYGGLMSFVAFLQVFFVIPRLLQIYQDFNAEAPTYGIYLAYIWFGVSLAQVIFGVYLWKKMKVVGELSKTLFWITVGVLLFDFLVTGFMQAVINMSTLFPIYNLTSQLN